MKAFVLVLVSSCAFGQDLAVVLKQGAQIFVQSCSAGYCHGTKGAGGGGPRLANRGFDESYIGDTVTHGIDQTSMPSFSGTLSGPEIAAVVAYVATLNGIANPTIRSFGGEQPVPAAPPLSAEAARGRDLFSEATRGFRRCSSCHEVDGIGIPVAKPIVAVPNSVAALRSLATPVVVTASVGGDRMPAVVVSNTSRNEIFYDLTAALPVMRTVEPGAVKFADGSGWQHSLAISGYTGPELQAVLEYLRAMIKP